MDLAILPPSSLHIYGYTSEVYRVSKYILMMIFLTFRMAYSELLILFFTNLMC